MRFLNTIALLAAAISAVSACDSTAADVLKALNRTDTDTKMLTTTINSWDGTQRGVIPIIQAYNNLNTDIRAVNATTFNATAFSCTDSTNLNNFITSPLEPDTLALTRAYVAKKTQFRAIGFQNVILQELQTLRTDYQGFFKSYATKTTCATQKPRESTLAAKVDTDFANGISQFSA